MPREYIVGDTIVACLTINNPIPSGNYQSVGSHFQSLTRQLEGICTPDANALKLFLGRAYEPFYPNNDDADRGCSWTRTKKRRWKGLVVLSLVDQPESRIRAEVTFVIAKDDSKAWLTIEYCPTTMLVGNNIHPAAYINPESGQATRYPSSDWEAMTRAFGLGFEFLEAMADGPLFDAETKLAIERGDSHLESAQWAATKSVREIRTFLQLIAVIYGQTIARGEGIISIANHLGLKFTPYTDPDTHLLTGVMFRKFHSKKPLWSVSLYDKRVRLVQTHQSLDALSVTERETVNQSVREDITAHSEGILVIVKAAQRKLETMGDAGLKFFDFISPEIFRDEEPKATVWWLQRAIFVLSHWPQKGELVRFSFATWLVPYVEQEVLHFDVIAAINSKGFHQLLALDHKLAEAWRVDPTPGADNWAGRLAQAAGYRSKQTVYNWQQEWRGAFGIDIEHPKQFYSDILFFGHNSIMKPENITALLVAVENEKGEETVRLHAEAITDFERKRLEVVNPALTSRPRAMPLEGPKGVALELDDAGDDLDDLSLIEAASLKKALAPPKPRIGGGVRRKLGKRGGGS